MLLGFDVHTALLELSRIGQKMVAMLPSSYVLDLVLRSGAYSEYFVNRIVNDVTTVCHEFRSLSCGLSTYTSGDGSRQSLLMIHGTIPITYRGAVYNIPVKVWVASWYPRGPPTPYVDPAPGMFIKESHPYVNKPDGLVINLRETTCWNIASGSLLDVLNEMIAVFTATPPVYCRRQPSTVSVSLDSEKRDLLETVTRSAAHCLTYASDSAKAERLALQGELDTLQQENKSLSARLDAISASERNTAEAMERVRNEYQRVADRLVAKNVDGGDLHWENVLVARDPYTDQIVDFTSRDFANKEAIRQATEALRRNQLDLDLYLREVQRLSTEEFTYRALRQKARRLQQQEVS